MKEVKYSAKKIFSVVKENKQREIESDLNNSENQNQIFRIATQIVMERGDVTVSSCLKDATSKMVVDKKWN